MLLLVLISYFVATAELVPIGPQLVSLSDKLFDKVLYSFNDLFAKPSSLPEITTSGNFTVGKTNVHIEGIGLQVEGEDFQRVGNSSGYTENGTFFYKSKVDVGGLRFTYNSVNVQVNGTTYKAAIHFQSYRTPVPYVFEKAATATTCSVTTGPFDFDFAQTTIDLTEAVDPATKDIISQVQKSSSFIQVFFLGAFFPTAQDPLFLLVKQFKLCDCLVGSSTNC